MQMLTNEIVTKYKNSFEFNEKLVYQLADVYQWHLRK